MAENCKTCGTLTQIYYYCDEDNSDKPYCTTCFEKHPCRTTPHPEGCETLVHDTDPNLWPRDPPQ